MTAVSPEKPLIDFANLTVLQGERKVLRNLTLRVRSGEHVAILGPNGSGKSTLIKTIIRELHPLANTPGFRFEILGREPWDVGELHQLFGVVASDLLARLSSEVVPRQVTAREMVLSAYFSSVGLWPHHRVTVTHRRQASAIMKFLEIEHLADRSLAAMSAGEQRRALIGRALVHTPAALILDEPTNSLDPGAAREFRQLLRKLARAGKGLVLVTHHVADILPEIDRVILMKNGSIVADGPKTELLTSAKLSRLFGRRLRLVRSGRDYDLINQ